MLWSVLLAACTTPDPNATLDEMRAAASTIDFATFDVSGGYPDEPAPDISAVASDDLARGAYEAVVSLTPAPPSAEETCLGGPPWDYTVEFYHQGVLALTAIVDPACIDVQLMSPAGVAADWCDVDGLLSAFGVDRATVDSPGRR
jgi:hypothetical protein